MLDIKHPKLWHEIKQSLPEIKDAILEKEGLVGSSVRELKGGFSNFVLLAKARDRECVIKISADEALPNEVYWYELANKRGLSAPKLISYDVSRSEIPYMYALIEYIGGGLPDWRSRREMQRTGLFAGRQIKKMQSIPVDGFGCKDSKFRWTDKTWLGALMGDRKSMDDRPALKRLTKREIDRIDELTVLDKGLGIRHPKLIHDDLYEMNILKRGAGFVMIDPGWNIGGDPMYALAYSLVPRSRGFDEGVGKAYPVSSLDDGERYRFQRLFIYRLFREMTEYIVNKDSRSNIDRLHKRLKQEIKSVS